ncbi:MAG: cation:proton antiporter [Deltaproteobacteria bacterium]|nr:cation:proton antiporter [Deltaproteobacteria bacterium]
MLFSPSGLIAADAAAVEAGHNLFPITFLWIAVILIAAKISSLIERVGQPAVLGELIIGVVIGSLYLFGIDIFEPIKTNYIIHFLAELGVVILLFQIGMESSVSSMMKVGVPSFLVACVGVILPMAAITYAVGPLLVPGLKSTAYLFLGATMTATSVGITARVLKDIGKIDTSEARIIIGAAVIDDVLGLIILAVVAAIVVQGSIELYTLSIIILKAVLFLGGGILIGTWLAPRLGSFFSKIQTGVGMKFAIVIAFGLVFAYIASLMGLAPIVGAFTAGLILKPVHFDNFDSPVFINDLKGAIKEENVSGRLAQKLDQVIETHSHKHIEVFTEHLGHFMVPIFFVLTGMQVKVATLMDPKVVLMAGGILIAAMLTKVAAGVAAGKGQRKLVVGIGMIPRGEVGLIFANMGKGLGVMDDTLFSAIVVVVMLTTLVTPPILSGVFKDK